MNLIACVLLLAANFRGRPGLIYEAEDWTTPRDAWLTNKVSTTKWNLWTTEGHGKRSRDASLVSPKIQKDRATPEEGAPVLHTHITGIPRGVYRAWLGPTTRPLAYSRDAGKKWMKSDTGETNLGIHEITDGAFDLWVDDRFANPANIGSAYYDYIRLEAFKPATLSEISVFTLPNGDTQLSWISSEMTPSVTVECDGRKFAEADGDLRNHRVVLTGLERGKAHTANVSGTAVKFVAGERPRIARSTPQIIELTVSQARQNWPVTSGVPFARGALASADDAQLLDAAGKPVPAQFEATSFWPDGSVKWLLISFIANAPEMFRLKIAGGGTNPAPQEAIPTCPAFKARIIDGNGKTYLAGKPDTTVNEERGPIRAVTRTEGDFVADDGAKLFRWQARCFAYAGQPWVRVSWTIGNNNTNAVLTNLREAGVWLPFTNTNAASVVAATNATPASGYASVSDGKHSLAAVVKDFWQTYPKGIATKPDGLHLRILPALPADAFAKESKNTEDLIRLYYCYDHGQYRIKRGLQFTTDFFVVADATVNPAWFDQPLFAVAPPQHYCTSGVFGVVEPRQPGLFDDYEKLVEDGFLQLEKNRREKREYGWMNYGDWFGERRFNWGNHEYDLMGALALQFARTGDLKYLQRADQASRHSTDIDTVHYPWQPRMSGRVYAHSVGHVGGFFGPLDLKLLTHGNMFIAGAIDPGGHIFQPGNFHLGFLTGERRYVEIAEMVCAAQATYLTAKFDFGIERSAGWPLMNAVVAYEATGNPFYLNAARLYVERIVAKQTERGDWNLPHGPPECLHIPTHPGGKAFAAGVLLNGLMMFDMVAPSPSVKQCIVRAAHWLEKHAWDHVNHGFRYIDTCPTYAKGRGNGGTDFLVSSGLAYACTLDNDPALKALLLDSLGRAMQAKSKVGKDYAQDIYQTPHALAILRQKFGLTQLPRVAAGNQ
jgi:hypothetical protein